MTATAQLPWTCPKHPQAQIRHSWNETQYVMNGYPAGQPIRGGHRYECAECGIELADEHTTPLRTLGLWKDGEA